MSRERRFFVPDLSSDRLELSREEAHHILHVLRLREGAPVTVFDGKGRAARAELSSIRGESVSLRLLGEAAPQESPLLLGIAVAPPKGDRMSVAVAKLTELGVRRILLLVTDRSEIDPGTIERLLPRWRRIVLESAKQSGRSLLPEIHPPRGLEEVLQSMDAPALAAHYRGNPLEASAPIQGSVMLLIGPPGGWSEPELQMLSSKEVPLFGLGPRTLRTETAAIAAATLAQWLWGDMGSPSAIGPRLPASRSGKRGKL